MSIRRVLAKRGENVFVKEDGTLTTFIEEAQVFEQLCDAMDLCQKHKLEEIDLLLRFDLGSIYDVRTPVGSPRANAT
jgi:hypothetical protein